MKKGLLLFTALLAACSLAPPYQRPNMPIPNHYKEAKTEKEVKEKPINKPIIKSPPDHWWTLFHDPVLNELQGRVTCANQDLKIAFARYQEARAAVQVASAAYYPTILGIANASRQQTSHNTNNITNLINTNSLNDATLFNNFLIGGEINYEVDVWGDVRNTAAASISRAEASAADLAGIDLSLHSQLAINYFSLRGDDRAQRILDSTVVAYEKALYLTRKRYKGGAAPVSDVDEAETQLENAKTAASDMRLIRSQMEHAIAILIGEVPANFTLSPANNPIKRVSITPKLPSTLLERRPDIIAAQLRVNAANADIGVARAAFFPQFNLSAVGGFQSTMLSNLISKPSLFWSLGPPIAIALTLSQSLVQVVIADGGKLQGLLNNATATHCETVASYRQTVLTAFQQVEDNLIAIRQLDKEYISQSAATSAAKRALIHAQKRYEGGLTTFLDVVVLENLALQSELALVNIRTRHQLASVQLIKALGGGWVPPCQRANCQTNNEILPNSSS